MPDQLNNTFDVRRNFRRYRFSAEYWQATREKKLVLQYSKRNNEAQFPPRPVSLSTGYRDLEFREVSGRGEVFTYTVVRKAFGAFQGAEPYLVASVTLDEGVNIVANLVHCELQEVAIGLRVKPYWLPLEDGTHLLMFEPDRDRPRTELPHRSCGKQIS